MKNVILSGGNGTRLWPLSRELMPKQFLKIFEGELSLFQQTIYRNSEIADSLVIVTNYNQYFTTLDQLDEINSKFTLKDTILLLEEVGKNTAPAITFVALESNKEEILFITPSDHLIKDDENYKKAVQEAMNLAKQGYLVTFGITPTEPDTGYGYIESNGNEVFHFHEKPNLEKAQEYLKRGNFYWNSGMFMFKAGVFLDELKKHSPKVYEEVLKSYKKRQKINNNQIRLKEMQNIPDISIDHAIMEKSNKIKVIPSKFDWNDVGSFDSLIKEIHSHEAIKIDSKNNFYYKDNPKKVISTIGLENFIVVDTRDALLIVKKSKTQKVKDIVNNLKKMSKEVTEYHMIVHRPWGIFENLIDENGYKIKRIMVKPGKRLSLQKHFHRNEHWIVVSGTAKVQIGDKTFLVRPNESTYIKMGEIHRLSNPGKIPVILIEIQVGEYTEEDDIVRIEDDYKR